MADVDPIIAQNLITTQELDQDLITEKIFLSPLAEKQWREDFSSEAQASKIFVLYLSLLNEDSIYVTSFINRNNDIMKDILEEGDCLDNDLINYQGIATRRYLPDYAPSSLDIKNYDYNFRTFCQSRKSVFLDIMYPSTNLDILHYSITTAFREIASINNSDIPRAEPKDFFVSVSDVVIGERSSKIEEQEMLLNNQKKAYRQTEASLESDREQFNKLFSDPASKQLESQIEAIKKFPTIKSIKFTDTDLIVYTNMLDIGVTDKNYDNGIWENVTMPLGEFEIKFELQQIMTSPFQSNYISFINLTEYKKGSPFIHPHIQGSPTGACLSQWTENFVQAGHNFSVIGLVSNAINYLRTFNPEDEYGENIFDFDGSSVFEGVCERNNDHQEYENGDYNRPGYGGEWYYYENGINGEFRNSGWEWYEEEANGEYRNLEWVWYDEIDQVEGDWDGITFYWYEDNEDFIQVDGDWIDASEDPNYIFEYEDGEWINAADDEDYYQVDDNWIHIDEIEETYASEYINNEQEQEVTA